jgi:phenylacetate-coenzyme A ligase PaaK-like adenylate-forming protein
LVATRGRFRFIEQGLPLKKRPLDEWLKIRMGGSYAGQYPTREEVRHYQLEKLRQTIDYAWVNSPFYSQHFRGLRASPLERIEDLCRVPFTTPEDLMKDPLRFLCVSQSEIERVVTLRSSGTTAPSKRLFFTEEDLERTTDFFHYGMHLLAEPGQRVLILMPGDSPGSVGDLLSKAVKRMDVEGIVHGPVRNPGQVIHEIVVKEIDCLAGIPVQVLSLIRHRTSDKIPPGRIKSVLLSADYVPMAIVKALEIAWGCRVINHYGTTEMGLGAAVECNPSAGYHLRDGDLFFEIIDPSTDQPASEGEIGEVVFTTLARKGMPLIRYRTGDVARFLPGPCPCGSVLSRMESVRGRLKGQVKIGHGCSLSMPELDEALFPIPGIINYQAEIGAENDLDFLKLTFWVQEGQEEAISRAAFQALTKIPGIRRSLAAGELRIEPFRFSQESWFTTGVAKRTISQQHEVRRIP